MKRFPKKFLLVFLLTVRLTRAEEAAPVPESNPVLRVLPRARPDRLYQLTIGLPDSFGTHPEKKYPVVFVTDGYWGFPTVSNICGGLKYGKHLPEVLVVGLGYAGDHLNYDQLRGDDLAEQEWIGQGGGHAANFLQVIESQAIPLLEKEFRADPNHRYIVGSSGGGLFALYALFTKPDLFQGYVADSPSIGALWNLEKEFAESGRTTTARVYISVAENEWTVYRRSIQVFHRRMAAHGYVKGGLQFRRIDHVRHSAGTAESFMQGLVFVAAPIAPEQGVSTEMMTDPQGRPSFIVAFQPVLGGITGILDPTQAEAWKAHRVFLGKLVTDKRVDFASTTPPDLNGHDSTIGFFARNRAEAEALVNEDPAVKARVLSYELIEETE